MGIKRGIIIEEFSKTLYNNTINLYLDLTKESNSVIKKKVSNSPNKRRRW